MKRLIGISIAALLTGATLSPAAFAQDGVTAGLQFGSRTSPFISPDDATFGRNEQPAARATPSRSVRQHHAYSHGVSSSQAHKVTANKTAAAH